MYIHIIHIIYVCVCMYIYIYIYRWRPHAELRPPAGWTPSREEMRRRLGPPEERPLGAEPPLADCLQYS